MENKKPKQAIIINPWTDSETVWVGSAETDTLRKNFRIIKPDRIGKHLDMGSKYFVAGVTVNPPMSVSTPHIHPDSEECSFTISGMELTNIGEGGEFIGTTGPGDFKFIPKNTYHGGAGAKGGNENADPGLTVSHKIWWYSAGGQLPTVDGMTNVEQEKQENPAAIKKSVQSADSCSGRQ